MITPQEERDILDRAYVPEHIVGLMAGISRGDPFLMDDCLGLRGDTWVILVGYPLGGDFREEVFGRIVADVLASIRPEVLWCVAPETPRSVLPLCGRRESDAYYTLALQPFELNPHLGRIVRRAARELTVERGRSLTDGHAELIAEFLEREKPGARIERLFLSMPDYVPRSETAVVLSARTRAGAASALYVVELAAKSFATYVVGCHSKRHYVVGASDLLFHEMIGLAREHAKGYLHLGLGVHAGIRRFKEKWGGVPGLRYEFCEVRRRDPFRRLPFLPRVGT